MAILNLVLKTVEYNDVTSDVFFVMDAIRPNAPLPPGVREDLATITPGTIRVGPVKMPKSPATPLTCVYLDPVSYLTFMVTWNPTTSTWSAPVQHIVV